MEQISLEESSEVGAVRGWMTTGFALDTRNDAGSNADTQIEAQTQDGLEIS